MPSSVRHNQPVARKKGRSGGPMQGCGAAGLRDALEHIAGQIGAADKRHGSALAEMQERLSQLTHKVDGVRAGFPKRDAGALARIEDGIDTLCEQIAHYDQPRQGQKGSGGASRAGVRAPLRSLQGAEAEAPWDAEFAEALTRVYERAEAELQRPSGGSRPRRDEAKAAPAQGPWQGEEPDRDWLEARLAGIDTLLKQALDGIDPDATLEAVKGRLDQFEARFDAALEQVARRSDLEGLALLETQLKELTRQFAETHTQLARLDSIDDGLRDLALGLDSQSQRPAAELDSKAIETLIDAAADRAAARLAGAMPATPPAADGMGAQKRVEALEELLQDYIEERRRGEEVTASILHTIEDALSRIVDRVDAIDLAKPASATHDDQHGLREDGLDIESARLAQAYAAGARVLGQGRAERAPSILDAADYTSFAPRGEASSEEPAATVAEDESGPEAATRGEGRPSDPHSKLMAHSAAAPGSQPRTDSGHGAPSGSSQGGHRTRVSSVLAIVMLLLFGMGYLVVDVFLTHGPASVGGQQPAASRADAQPGAEAAQFGLDTGSGLAQSPSEAKRPQLVAPVDGEPSAADIVPPAKRPQHVPETVTDDTSPGEPGAGWQSSSIEASGHGMATALAATTVALPRETGAQAMPQGRTLLGRDHPALLPTGIGPAALRNAAAGGDADAAFEVATRYAEGKAVAQDLKQAFAWYQRAAAQGHAAAQFRVAAFHERGIAGAADRGRAALWYRRAAEQGHVKAMHNLAVLLAGRGADRPDYASAARWFREAAERGLVDSQYNLAALCEDGHGVARSLAEAYKWFALAARGGDRGAAQRLAQIKGRLNPGELAAAQQMVATWHVREAGAVVDGDRPSAAGPDGAVE